MKTINELCDYYKEKFNAECEDDIKFLIKYININRVNKNALECRIISFGDFVNELNTEISGFHREYERLKMISTQWKKYDNSKIYERLR